MAMGASNNLVVRSVNLQLCVFCLAAHPADVLEIPPTALPLLLLLLLPRCRCIVDILRAVAQCHAKGVVVCDVKPENFLFVTPREDAPLKMADFGLAQYCKQDQVLSER
jgi:serine/threonine protein kinase